jgi:hypothetical protein
MLFPIWLRLCRARFFAANPSESDSSAVNDLNGLNVWNNWNSFILYAVFR